MSSKNPRVGDPDTTVTIVKYWNQAMSIIQDSKHALKTFWNNLFSGTHLLALGNIPAMYNHTGIAVIILQNNILTRTNTVCKLQSSYKMSEFAKCCKILPPSKISS
jgi:hypothetical protein